MTTFRSLSPETRKPESGIRSSEYPSSRMWLAVAVTLASTLAITPAEAQTYRVLGQPTLVGETLASRCGGGNQRFNQLGLDKGPVGLAIDPDGRLFATDFGGRRVLMWASVDALSACQDATVVASNLGGPQALVYDPESKTLFVADTLRHVVLGFKQSGTTWSQQFALGVSGSPGNGSAQFTFPRGIAVDPDGRLFVADDFINRIQIFDPPFNNGESAVDSISASGNGGFANPKAVAMVGHTLFVADYSKNRVLRFTGPFTTPGQDYIASGIFGGVFGPIDLAVHPDGSLLVTDQANIRIARYADAAFSTDNAPTSGFNDNMNVEPMGVAADRSGRIYIADYSAFRVLIRDEFVSLIRFNASQYAFDESDGAATVIVQRGDPIDQSATIDFNTTAGTATPGVDYSSASGTLTFAVGEATKSIQVPILDDGMVEGDETFNVTLSNPSVSATLASPSSAVVVISDNDAKAPSSGGGGSMSWMLLIPLALGGLLRRRWPCEMRELASLGL